MLIRSFDPVIDEDARVLILGSMPGKVSLEKAQYYAHPRNKFWILLYSVFDMQPDPDYKQKIAFLKSRKIALWDVFKECRRTGSADSDILNPVVNDFIGLLNTHPGIKSVLFNGTKAAQIFKKNSGQIRSGISFFTLPSSSPANAGISLEDKLKAWIKIKDLLGN
jgi:methylated-DNA-[protein]-cysteine S-methyltransferase